MVSVVQLHPQNDDAIVARALAFAEKLYGAQRLSTGEPAWPHAQGLAANLAAIGMDPAARAAGALFAAPKFLTEPGDLEKEFGQEVRSLAAGVEKLYQLRVLTRDSPREQNEVLRKMVLGMVEDVRVVPIRLASRTQTLRWLAKNPSAERAAYARETLNIYAPLANRLGIWQLKWELEDLSFRFLEPGLYQRIAGMIDERRLERERYIREAITRLASELRAAGIGAEVTGRPKHIFSIYHKMLAKRLDFDEVHDVRALRVIVDTAQDCYAALGAAHNLWPPIPREFDDYISRPKGNLYQSLHTAVIGPEGRVVEVQIRTHAMHRQAEFGIAAHWRYKEAGAPARAASAFDRKIAWLRQLLAWRDEVAEAGRGPLLDDTVYALTPQGKVIDLPAGATPVDFAYALHTDLGHRCRGAKVDGRIVPLDARLASGQRVEILAAKAGGPSRDWLTPALGFVRSPRARQKIRHWFNAQEAKRAPGDTPKVARAAPKTALPKKNRPRTAGKGGNVLVLGVGRLLTQVARCCKPAAPAAIRGFVTRSRGVSIHSADCKAFARLAAAKSQRVVDAEWEEF